MSTVIRVENISKFYKLGLIGGGSLHGDLTRWWARARGKPDPLLKIGQADHGNQSGEYIWALRDVSFDVEQGEVIGIIGKNGSGKSTLLKIISHITAPTSGEIKIKGRIGALLEVGTGFHPELTGKENVYLNGAILGMTNAEVSRKFDEIVDFSGVSQFIDTPVKRYSSGMKVRLAFAVAAHLDPEILVIDEVLAVGDAEFQKKCLGKMGEVAKEGRTVLFVSHNMAAVISLCTKSFLLSSGQLITYGDTESVVSQYMRNAETISAIPVAQRTDRTGDGKLRITSIRITNGNGSDTVRCGDSLRIYIHYKSETEQSKLTVVIKLHDELDRCVYLLRNRVSRGFPQIIPATGSIVCITEPINMTPGPCFVSVEIFIASVTADNLRNICTFNIEPDDFFGTGKLTPRSEAPCMLRHRWEIESDPKNISNRAIA